MTSAYDTPQALASAAADRFFAEVRALAAARRVVWIGLSGGTSWDAAFARIVARAGELSHETWAALRFFLVDERLVPRGHPDSNADAAEAKLLKKLAGYVAPEQFVVPDVGAPDVAERYAAAVPRADLVLLGAGPDGHVASLFPGHAGLARTQKFFTVDDSPKPPARRVTASVPFLSAASSAVALFVGAAKADAFAAFQAGATITLCPAAVAKNAAQWAALGWAGNPA